MHVAVRCYEPWRPAEQAQVILQSWLQLSFVARVAFEYPKPAHDAPFHLREPHLPPKLGLLAGLTPADYGRVGLEDGNQLLGGGHLLFLDDPPLSLLGDPPEEPCEVGKLF
jgi:hypothetical protein